MTQHFLHEHTQEDQLIVRRLAIVIGGFIVATAIMAIAVGALMA